MFGLKSWQEPPATETKASEDIQLSGMDPMLRTSECIDPGNWNSLEGGPRNSQQSLTFLKDTDLFWLLDSKFLL